MTGRLVCKPSSHKKPLWSRRLMVAMEQLFFLEERQLWLVQVCTASTWPMPARVFLFRLTEPAPRFVRISNENLTNLSKELDRLVERTWHLSNLSKVVLASELEGEHKPDVSINISSSDLAGVLKVGRWCGYCCCFVIVVVVVFLIVIVVIE